MSYNEIKGRSQRAHLGKPRGLSVVDDFLWESNAIESEFSKKAFIDAKRAWKYIKKIDELKISDILEVHRLLAHRINPRIAGKLRECNVSIGGQIKKYRGREVLLGMLERYLELTNLSFMLPADLSHEDSVRAAEAVCKEGHIAFEDIHPFEDGNGRTGRILYNWHRIQKGLPIHVIHADGPKKNGDQQNYYKWFK